VHLDEARRRVALARVARLATVSADGAPHVVPCVFALDGEVLFTAVDAKPKSTTALRRLDNIRAEPRVSLLVDHYDEDWTALWWVRVDGTARVVDAGPDRDRGVTALVAKYAQYRPAPPPGPVVVVAVRRWRCWP
jgi:PPOX class probable F420-dependent enzyme